MGSILTRKRKDGSNGYTALVRIKRGGKVVHTESQTFGLKRDAQRWITAREAELAKPGALDRPDDPALADIIDRYIEESEKTFGSTKIQVLSSIKAHDIGARRASEIDSEMLLSWLQSINAKPQTRSVYASNLNGIFMIARPAWGYPLDKGQMQDALAVARMMGLVGKSAERERRPTLEELDRLMEHFGRIRARRRYANDMQAIVAFAIYSTRRLGEICRAEWHDLDEEGSRLMVRDMKHPTEKAGNDTWCNLVPEALAIAAAMPRNRKRIFSCSEDAVSSSFTRACKILGIRNLRLHDMRHHGISRLVEMGKGIPETASYTGHRSWATLQRYAHYRKTGDCLAGWPWLPRIIERLNREHGTRQAGSKAGPVAQPMPEGSSGAQQPHDRFGHCRSG